MREKRGSLTVWFSEEAIKSWRAAPGATPGGQPNYYDLAITTALTASGRGSQRHGVDGAKPA